MPTPVSHTTSYCTVAEFLERVDWRLVGDYLSTTGDKLTRNEVLASTVLANLLKQASGELDSACLVSGRYTIEDLTALTTNSLNLLKGIVAGIALPYLWDLRPEKQPPELRVEKWAKEKVQELRHGERIFGLQGQIDAGKPQSTVEAAVDVEERNLATFQAERFFGRRSNRVDR